MTEVDFEYSVRDAVDADRRFIIETTARVRQPHGVNWAEWEPFGMLWARTALEWDESCHVVEARGVLLGFSLVTQDPRAVECLYVKRDFRGLGFGQLLLDAAGMDQPVPVRAPTDSFRMWASKRGIKFTVMP